MTAKQFLYSVRDEQKEIEGSSLRVRDQPCAAEGTTSDLISRQAAIDANTRAVER